MRALAQSAPPSHEIDLGTQQQAALSLPSLLGSEATTTLERMFRDPRTLEAEERIELVAQLRNAVALTPQIPELRVMLGMALCVDLQAQQAMEELREAVRIAPDSFIAELKLGELLMRLRICDQAKEHTHRAALLACNPIQSELARKQAATIRSMSREGIERGGYSALLPRIFRSRRKAVSASNSPVLVGTK